MSKRSRGTSTFLTARRAATAAVAGAGLLALAGGAAAQEEAAAAARAGTAPADSRWTAPRTAWGAPDLQGIWDYRSATPLERPAEFADQATLTDAEAAAFEQRHSAALDDYDRSPSVHAKWWLDNGRKLTAGNRTSLIVDPPDGRIPPTSEAARAAAQARRDRRARTDAVDDRSLGERCITFGMPRFPGAYNNNYQILQTPTHVAIVVEMIHDVRIVPIDGRPPLSDALPQWHGDSRGFYDGDTLVVETANFSPKSAFRGSTAGLRLVERFTRVGPDALQYEITVSDPATWARAWTAVVPMTSTDQPIYEYACHEGNRGLHNILHNARFAENPEYEAALSAPAAR